MQPCIPISFSKMSPPLVAHLRQLPSAHLSPQFGRGVPLKPSQDPEQVTLPSYQYPPVICTCWRAANKTKQASI